MEKMLNEKIIKIKNKFYETETKKSGKNTFQGYQYFELKDFLPLLIKLMAEEEVNDIFTINNEYATLKLIYKDEVNEYTIPFEMFDVPLNKQGKDSMQKIQYLGALSTYYKRYLFMNAFSITENDIIETMNNDELNNKQQSKKQENTKSNTKEQDLKTRIGFLKKSYEKHHILIDKYIDDTNKSEDTAYVGVDELNYEKIVELSNLIKQKEIELKKLKEGENNGK